jgi:hypothetical protein
MPETHTSVQNLSGNLTIKHSMNSVALVYERTKYEWGISYQQQLSRNKDSN